MRLTMTLVLRVMKTIQVAATAGNQRPSTMTNEDLAIIARAQGWIRVNHPIPGLMNEYRLLWDHRSHKRQYESLPPYDTDPALMLELMIKYSVHVWKDGPDGKWCAAGDNEIDVSNNRDPPAAVAACALAIIKGEKE